MAGRLTIETVERVKERADIVELVEARTGPVRRTGAGVMARCPFHEERSASFSIDPVKKLYHCFGCGEGGDVLSLVIKLEGLGFEDAVELLADRYGIEVEREQLSGEEARRRAADKRLDALLAEVALFYRRYLETAQEAEPARAYLSSRAIAAEQVDRFGLGFAPASGRRVVQAARAKGYSDAELEAAAVARRGQGGLVDRFRDRVIFPLRDARGRVRGFGARVMEGGEGPKYLNSPQSASFDKSRLLYGLDLARAAIARRGRAIVAEGYTDVIALHAAGFEEAVGAMGTALTGDQLRELRRLAPRLILCFDSDAAGQEATVRGLRLAEEQGFDVRVLVLPFGKDPAELLAAGEETFERAVAEARSVVAFLVDRALDRAATEGTNAAYNAVRDALTGSPVTPERTEEARRAAERLGLDRTLAEALVRLPGDRGSRPATDGIVEQSLSRGAEAERALLAGIVAAPADARRAVEAGELSGDLLTTPAGRALYDWSLAEDAPPPAGLEADAAAINALARRIAPATFSRLLADARFEQLEARKLALEPAVRRGDREAAHEQVRLRRAQRALRALPRTIDEPSV